MPGLTIIGTSPEKAGVISLVLKGVPSEEVGARLNKYGIAVRSGHHRAQPILRRFGHETTVRPSFAFYNTCGEIDTWSRRCTTSRATRACRTFDETDDLRVEADRP